MTGGVTWTQPDKIKNSTGLVVTCDLQKNPTVIWLYTAIICTQKYSQSLDDFIRRTCQCDLLNWIKWNSIFIELHFIILYIKCRKQWPIEVYFLFFINNLVFFMFKLFKLTFLWQLTFIELSNNIYKDCLKYIKNHRKWMTPYN